MNRVAVINVVGLTRRLIGERTPNLKLFVEEGHLSVVEPPLPAVTCTVQANYLTGKTPTHHGIVGNGWYDRDLAEVHFWKQCNRLVQAPKIWDGLRSSLEGFTCAKLFWWYNMYATVDYSITPRPMYPADGRKVFDIYTWPYSIRSGLKESLGEFPFPCFWGPAAGVASPQGEPEAVSRWIADASMWIERQYQPTVSLIYLPHLDYNLQRYGPSAASIDDDLGRIDAVVGDLIGFFSSRDIQVVILSEYGITPVDRPIHLNRLFREQGWLTIKEELGRELLDFGASRAFAVADHQLAHVYVQDMAMVGDVRAILEGTPGVDRVLGADEKRAAGLAHSRAGDLVAVASEDAWFTYYYWNEDRVAPDFAPTVDIHRKPGYDPAELFLDPAIGSPKLRVGLRLLQKKLGFRMLMDVIPLDAGLVKGSHGARPASEDDWPIIAAERPLGPDPLASTSVAGILQEFVRGR